MFRHNYFLYQVTIRGKIRDHITIRYGPYALLRISKYIVTVMNTYKGISSKQISRRENKENGFGIRALLYSFCINSLAKAII